MITPFSYQEEGLVCIDRARSAGEKKALVVMATRLGKTITAAFDVKRFSVGRKTRLLYLCHKTDILYQARSDFELVLGQGKTYGFFHGTEKNFHEIDCLFSSFDTMRNYLEFFDSEEFDYLIVDESHHSHASTYLPVIRHFQPKFMLGLTATPDRMDLQDITEIYGKPVFELPLEKALAAGYLTPLDYRVMTDEIQLEELLKTPDKLWSLSALNHQIFIPKRDDEIARLITWETSRIKDAKTIIFCPSVKYCDQLVKLIPDSLTIHSRIPQKERDIRLEMFRGNMLNTVITVDCFNEGIDIPRANVIVFLRSTASRTIFLQQLGRGLTKSEGKDKVIVLDFVANLERIEAIQEMYRKVMESLPKGKRVSQNQDSKPITLEVGKVMFHERKIELTELLDRILKKERYPTWKEASEAVKLLGIRTMDEYCERYKEDGRLPAAPHSFYSDFPTYADFFGRESLHRTNIYPTWKEAAAAAKTMGIKSRRQYDKCYKEDPKLPAAPFRIYVDFPGWGSFLGTGKTMRAGDDVYSTLAKARRATRKLGFTKESEYKIGYKQDPRLPSSPERKYEKFPGWPKFLGVSGVVIRKGTYERREVSMYVSWQEASAAAKMLGITNGKEYRRGAYKKDPRLPSSPFTKYSDFPGWDKFLGRD